MKTKKNPSLVDCKILFLLIDLCVAVFCCLQSDELLEIKLLSGQMSSGIS